MLNNQMKQKRKVKSLLPRKNYVEGKILTILLLVLSLVLCIGSASLLTHSVKASEMRNPIAYSPFVDPTIPPTLPERTITIDCVYTGDRGAARDPVVQKCIRYMPYDYYVPDDVTYYEPNTTSVSGTCTGNRSFTVIYNPIHDLNGNGIADEEENLQEVTSFTYTGLDNRVEVIYSMQFVDPSDLKRFVNSIYVSGGSLYITPNPVIVNYPSNIVDTGMYSHILGGSGNRVYSDNVTLIAGKDNIVYSGNENASVLGGNGNKFYPGKSGGKPLISIGGKLNIVNAGSGHDGVVLVGGSGNVISGVNTKVSNSFILGGEENSIVEVVSGAIIGGTRVLDYGHSNIFVYSNEYVGFAPASSNAFYLNMVGGVGINTGGIEGLSVGGAVSFGEINIHRMCSEDNYGVMGTYSGCLVGCTKTSSEKGGKWQMLDQGSNCAAICNIENLDCYIGDSAEIVPDNYPAECTVGVVNTGNARVCSDDLSDYINVIFETSLIDSETTCPSDGKNVCLYQCNEGYHLTGDYAGGTEEIGCFKDCEINWADSEVDVIKHNEIVFGYNSGSLSCEFGGGNCDDYKKKLVCASGTLYIATGENNIADLDSEGEAAEYIYKKCKGETFYCSGALETGYTLGWNKVKSDLQGNGYTSGNFPGGVSERTVITGVAGQYKVCYEYKGVEESCEYVQPKFKNVGCNSGYRLVDGECKKNCDNGLEHGLTGMFYTTSGVECNGSCNGREFMCSGGDMYAYFSAAPHRRRIIGDNPYIYTGCSLLDEVCSGYNVTETEYNQYNDYGAYTGCTKYGVENNACVTGSTSYKLEYCYSGYHTENGKWCVEDYKPCLTPDNPEFGADGVITGYGMYYYTNPLNWNYVTGNSNPGTCQWSCAEGYERDGNGCVQIAVPGVQLCSGHMPDNYYNAVYVRYYNVGRGIVLQQREPGGMWMYTDSDDPGSCEFTCDSEIAYWDAGSGMCLPNGANLCASPMEHPVEKGWCSNGSTGYDFKCDVNGLCTWYCNEDDIGNEDLICRECLYGGGSPLEEGGCQEQRECNYCAENGFPYCIPFSFEEGCIEP